MEREGGVKWRGKEAKMEGGSLIWKASGGWLKVEFKVELAGTGLSGWKVKEEGCLMGEWLLCNK